MDWKKYYQERLTTAEEAVKKIPNDSVLILQHCAGEPPILVDALVKNAAQYKNVEISHMFTLGPGTYSHPEYREHFHMNSWFNSAPIRKGTNEVGDYTTCYLHEIPELLRNGTFHVDSVLANLSLPNEDGYMSTGVSGDYTVQAIKSASLVIAQVNAEMPFTPGGCLIHVSEVDWFVEHNDPIYALPEGTIGDVERAIGKNCASVIEDGACIQLGIGSIPNAICEELYHKKHLGVHSEMMGDGMMKLYKAGVIDNSMKQIDKGKMIFNFVMGTTELYKFIDKNEVTLLMPEDYSNDPRVIAQNDNVVAVNGGLEVNFYGEVASDMIGYTQFAGVGGQVDFIRGAAWSKNGKSIIAMPSTTVKKDGTMISKIKPHLTEGAAVATSRNDIDYVCTEYGIVRLKGRTTIDRARLLISIAHPQFREELGKEFEKFFGRPYTPIEK